MSDRQSNRWRNENSFSPNEVSSRHPYSVGIVNPSGAITKIQAQLNQFLNYIRIEKGLSANTVASYRRDLMKFVNMPIHGNSPPSNSIVKRYVISFGSLEIRDCSRDPWRGISSPCVTFSAFSIRMDKYSPTSLPRLTRLKWGKACQNPFLWRKLRHY